MDSNLTEEQQAQQKAYLQEELKKAVAFEALKTSEAFTYLQAYYENLVKQFTNTAIIAGFKSMEEFNLERGKVLSIRSMFGDIESSLNTLEEERKKAKENESTQ